MQIRKLLLTNFRSCAHVALEPAGGINIFVGANAQGKSTLLEAIYMLASTRSPRAGKDAEMIRWGQSAALAGSQIARELRSDVDVEISLSHTEQRVMRVNQTRRMRVADVVGQLNAVLFSVDDLEIVRGEPAVRRRFLNLETSQVSAQYCHSLVQYRRILEQRNRLLKLIRDSGHSADTLESWNDQLVAAGSRLVSRRMGFIAELSRYAAQIHADLAGSAEELAITYLPSFPAPQTEGVAAAFLAHLAPLQREEVARGATLIGPHRDDLLFSINGMDTRVFGSQGQQRTVALATRMAEVELMRERIGEAPVLLLDDPASELDERRRQRLFDLISGTHQSFIACTEEHALPPEVRRKAAHYLVQAGKVARKT